MKKIRREAATSPPCIARVLAATCKSSILNDPHDPHSPMGRAGGGRSGGQSRSGTPLGGAIKTSSYTWGGHVVPLEEERRRDLRSPTHWAASCSGGEPGALEGAGTLRSQQTPNLGKVPGATSPKTGLQSGAKGGGGSNLPSRLQWDFPHRRTGSYEGTGSAPAQVRGGGRGEGTGWGDHETPNSPPLGEMKAREAAGGVAAHILLYC